ncbi:ABC transporter substrate-binding protein [Actinacidiphila sp. ITFR-21]|uniref:ABC transporter substrate-binding protein n=1 Tax=Actinacidiphila sp. ITFR-21 TaxID=3075199 RepID=UPI00288B4ADB|nr:ABC transporter substrate-binding protein [Streptomyces sp. ITFR-21]WNI18761.1 ABC transporter substrate-binding protein [Streptomyces sp. ITFR-21]
MSSSMFKPRRTRHRLWLLTAGVAMMAVTAAGCSGSDSGSDSGSGTAKASGDGNAAVTLKVGAVPTTSALALFAALDQGYFTAEELNVKLNFLANGSANVSATVGGSQDMFYGDLFAWASAVENGFSLKLLAGANSNTWKTADGTEARGASSFLVPKDSSVKDAKALAGKKIGVNGTPQTRLFVAKWLTDAGVDPTSVKFVTVAGGPAALQALSGKSVDAILTPPPYDAEGVSKYGFKEIGSTQGLLPPNALIAGFFSTSKYASAHPETVKKFVSAVRKGAAYANSASPAKRAAILKAYAHFDIPALATTTGVNDLVQKMPYPVFLDSALDVGQTQQGLDLATKLGVLDKPLQLAANTDPTATEK